MGYFSSSGTWRNPNMTSWQGYQSGSAAAGILGSMPGHETGGTISASDKYTSNVSPGDVSWGTIGAGPAQDNMITGLKGLFGRTLSSWSPGDEYMAFSPMGKQVMGQAYDPGVFTPDDFPSEEGADTTTYEGGWSGGTSARGKRFNNMWGADTWSVAQPEAEATLEGYIGPTFTGGWTRDMENFNARMARLMDTPEWSPPDELTAKPDASSLDIGQGGTGWMGAGGYSGRNSALTNYSPDYEQSGDATQDVRGVGGTLQRPNIYAKTEADYKDLMRREFGTFDASQIKSLKPFEGSDWGNEIRDLEQDRSRNLGSLAATDTGGGMGLAEERLGGFLDYINPSSANAEDIFDIQYHNVDNPSTATDERQTIDWEKTLGGAANVGDVYSQQLDKYFGPGGQGAYAGYDTSDRGDFLRNFLQGGVQGMGGENLQDIYGMEGLQGAAAARRKEDLALHQQEGELGDIRKERQDIGGATREGLLGETLASQRGLYESGFSGMGDRPEVQSARQKYLESGQADLTDIQRRIREGRVSLDLQSDVAKDARTKEENLMKTMRTPWQILTDQFEDMQREYGTQWSSDLPMSYHANIWDSIETGLNL